MKLRIFLAALCVALFVACSPAVAVPVVAPAAVPVLASPVAPTATSAPANTATSAPTATNAPGGTPSLAATATRTPTRAPTATAVPTVSPLQPLFARLADEAAKRRAQDPTYAVAADPELNKGRVNALLFCYGETLEPPAIVKPGAIIGSPSVVSYDTRSGEVDIVSLTHDIRAPEVEQALGVLGSPMSARRLDRAYLEPRVGGIPLLRRVIADATGLWPDYVVVCDDTIVKSVVDDVFGGVTVDVPLAFDAHPIFINSVERPRKHYARGKQPMNGSDALQYIKAVPVADGAYPPQLEHNVRKRQVFEALLTEAKTRIRDREFVTRLGGFIVAGLVNGTIKYDFDPVALIVAGLNALPDLKNVGDANIAMPTIRHAIYVVDPAHGDGGVQWVTANAAWNPVTSKDIQSGVYPGLDMEVPSTPNANPYGNLTAGYWKSVRELVKKTLTGP